MALLLLLAASVLFKPDDLGTILLGYKRLATKAIASFLYARVNLCFFVLA